jgi:hypothetical protein
MNLMFGNLFLTNIHRVHMGEVHEPSLEDNDLRDYFLSPFGDKPVGKTTDSQTDLGEIVREISNAVRTRLINPEIRDGLAHARYAGQ